MEIFIYPLILIILVIWQIFPLQGFWIYLIAIIIFSMVAVPPIFTARRYYEAIKQELLLKLSYEEYDFLRRHAIYYMYPFGARSFSATCAFLQLTGIVFGIVFLIRQYWFYGIICILNYPIFAFIAPMLNKPFYLADAVRNGTNNLFIIREAELAHNVGNFMENNWEDFIKEIKDKKEPCT